MATEYIELICVGEVSASTEVAHEYTPVNNASVILETFEGDGAYIAGSVIKVVWDYGVTNDIVWTIKGDASKPDMYRPTYTGDGTKKIALACQNGEGTAIYLSGYVRLRIET